jgi:hypothetical protein
MNVNFYNNKNGKGNSIMLLAIHIRDFLEQFKLFKSKDAGFIYESFRNETNQIFWDFWPYKSNPQYESFKNRSTKRIHDTNLSKTGLWNESAIRILKVGIRKSGFASPPAWIRMDSFHAIVLRICEDLLDSWKQAESFKNRSTKRIHNTNPQGLDSQIRIRKSASLDSSITIQNKSFWSQDSYPRYETNPWIRETNPCFYESLIRFPHP